jgi:hypothetical protein
MVFIIPLVSQSMSRMVAFLTIIDFDGRMPNIVDSLPAPPHEHFAPDTHPELYQRYISQLFKLDSAMRLAQQVEKAVFDDNFLASTVRFSASVSAYRGLCFVVRNPFKDSSPITYTRESFDHSRKPSLLKLPAGKSLLLDTVRININPDQDDDESVYRVVSSYQEDGYFYSMDWRPSSPNPWVYLDLDPRGN